MCSSMRFYIGVGHCGAARPCAQPRTSLPAVGTQYVPPLAPLQWPAASFREPQSAFEERQAAEDSWTESTALLRDHACLPLKRP